MLIFIKVIFYLYAFCFLCRLLTIATGAYRAPRTLDVYVGDTIITLGIMAWAGIIIFNK